MWGSGRDGIGKLGGTKQQSSCHAKVATFSGQPGQAVENFKHARLPFQKGDSRLCHGGLGSPAASEECCSDAGPGESLQPGSN